MFRYLVMGLECMKCEVSVRKLDRGEEEKEVKRKVEDCKEM